ncbi:MAG: hypothetical protein J07HR59_01571 [Halorubrum sp. J07HR59]|nr:MAG: hypothetical protein J07HR59_01571 [Halorubrum sp. J07HR59]
MTVISHTGIETACTQTDFLSDTRCLANSCAAPEILTEFIDRSYRHLSAESTNLAKSVDTKLCRRDSLSLNRQISALLWGPLKRLQRASAATKYSIF